MRKLPNGKGWDQETGKLGTAPECARPGHRGVAIHGVDGVFPIPVLCLLHPLLLTPRKLAEDGLPCLLTRTAT